MFEPSLAPAHSCTSATAGATARRARRLCMQRTSERQLLGRLGKLGSSARQAARLDYGASCGGRTVQPAMRTTCVQTEPTFSFGELCRYRWSRAPLCAPHKTIGVAGDRSALRTRTRRRVCNAHLAHHGRARRPGGAAGHPESLTKTRCRLSMRSSTPPMPMPQPSIFMNSRLSPRARATPTCEAAGGACGP